MTVSFVTPPRTSRFSTHPCEHYRAWSQSELKIKITPKQIQQFIGFRLDSLRMLATLLPQHELHIIMLAIRFCQAGMCRIGFMLMGDRMYWPMTGFTIYHLEVLFLYLFLALQYEYDNCNQAIMNAHEWKTFSCITLRGQLFSGLPSQGTTISWMASLWSLIID